LIERFGLEETMSAFTRIIIGSVFVFASVIPAAPQSANRTAPATPATNTVGTLAAAPADIQTCRAHCQSTSSAKHSVAERQARADRCAHTMVVDR
jgi:hypothetical protein